MNHDVVVRVVASLRTRTYQMGDPNRVGRGLLDVCSEVWLPPIPVERCSTPSAHDLIDPPPLAGPILVPFDPVLEDMVVPSEHQIHAMLAEQGHPVGPDGPDE